MLDTDSVQEKNILNMVIQINYACLQKVFLSLICTVCFAPRILADNTLRFLPTLPYLGSIAFFWCRFCLQQQKLSESFMFELIYHYCIYTD